MQVVCLHVGYGMDYKTIMGILSDYSLTNLLTTCSGFYCPAFRQPPESKVGCTFNYNKLQQLHSACS